MAATAAAAAAAAKQHCNSSKIREADGSHFGNESKRQNRKFVPFFLVHLFVDEIMNFDFYRSAHFLKNLFNQSDMEFYFMHDIF